MFRVSESIADVGEALSKNESDYIMICVGSWRFSIPYLDTYLKEQTVADPYFKLLLGLPGVWYTLGLTIYYETGDIQRFDTAKRYASYARLVPALHQSAQTKKKGKGGKQGNHYLKWAFTQAASIAVRYYPKCRKFRDKHARRRDHLKAKNIIANCIFCFSVI